jgi:hypothetical protein
VTRTSCAARSEFEEFGVARTHVGLDHDVGETEPESTGGVEMRCWTTPTVSVATIERWQPAP